MKPENEEDMRALRDAYKLASRIVCKVINMEDEELTNKAFMLHWIIANWYEPILEEELEKYRRKGK